MLLRSTSSLVLKTLQCQSSTSRPAVSMCLQRTASDSDVEELSLTKEKVFAKRSFMSPVLVKKKEETNVCIDAVEEDKMVSREVGGGGGGGGGGNGSWDSSHGPNGSDHQRMNIYYQNLVKAYPDDALHISNYAKFLKEVLGDSVKAEEFCERAILANGSDDGKVLSMYGELIWNNHRDSNRAQAYFDRAIQSSPDDCYILASYAHFLWDVGEEVEEEEIKQSEFQFGAPQTCKQPHDLPQGLPPFVAAPKC